MSDDKYNRWQRLAIGQFSVAIALVSGLSLAALGTGIRLLQDDGFANGASAGTEPIPFAYALLSLVFAVFLSFVSVITRLLDFGLTARTARKRTRPSYDRSLTFLGLGPDTYGKVSKVLFAISCALFLFGCAIFVVSIGIRFSDRLSLDIPPASLTGSLTIGGISRMYALDLLIGIGIGLIVTLTIGWTMLKIGFSRLESHDDLRVRLAGDGDEPSWSRAVVADDARGINTFGHVERTLYFALFAIGAHIAVAGVLAFKVASKWEVWANVIQLDKNAPAVKPRDYLRIRNQYGTWLLLRFLLGTFLSVLAGLVGAVAARYFWAARDVINTIDVLMGK